MECHTWAVFKMMCLDSSFERWIEFEHVELEAAFWGFKAIETTNKKGTIRW